MKTSNKLLLGFLIVLLIGITTFASVARFHLNSNTVKGNGKAKIHTQEVKGFNKINIHGRFKVHLIQGTNTQLEIRASENLIPLVNFVVENEELKINLKNRVHSNDRIELFLTAADVTSLDISAGTELNSVGIITGDSLEIDNNAGTNVTLKLNYKSIDAESNAGSKLSLNGAAPTAKFTSTSGAIIEAFNLTTKSCKALASAGGVAEINVTGDLDVSANSGGSVNYMGNPSIKNIDSNSGGSVNKK